MNVTMAVAVTFTALSIQTMNREKTIDVDKYIHKYICREKTIEESDCLRLFTIEDSRKHALI